ncbi:MAG: MerR family DNA-binding transcriptional regulator [bacterium]
MEHKYINIKQASEMLGVSKLTLRNWDRDGKLSAKRHPISNYRVYLAEDLEKIIKQIESGEKPIRPKKEKKIAESEKPKFYKLKVIHMQD